MEMKNREQRRREKFGRAGKVSQHDPLDPWPQNEANPALKNVASGQAAVAADPDVEPGTAPEPATITDEKAKAPRPARKTTARPTATG